MFSAGVAPLGNEKEIDQENLEANIDFEHNLPDIESETDSKKVAPERVFGGWDVLDPLYITVAPKTIILKLCIGLITGAVAHKTFRILHKEGKELKKDVFIASACGMLFNCIAEPLFGYFYTSVILGAPEKAAKALASWNAITTCTNAVLSVIIASLLYLAIYPRLRNNGVLKKIGPNY